MIRDILSSKAIKKLYRLLQEVSDKRIDTYSACAAFYIFISFIPFALILLSTIKYLPFTKQDLLDFIDGIMPLKLNGVIIFVIDELYSRGIGIMSLAIIAAIWSSCKGVLGITKGLNDIFDIPDSRGYFYLRGKSVLCTLILMIGLILMLIISVFGNSIIGIVQRFVTIPGLVMDLLSARDVVMFVILFIVFLFMFCVLPAGKISAGSQIPGAFGASLVWILFTKLFSVYLSTFKGYSMYGSFAVILVMGIWLYAGMYIMFMGALANKMIASRKGINHER